MSIVRGADRVSSRAGRRAKRFPAGKRRPGGSPRAPHEKGRPHRWAHQWSRARRVGRPVVGGRPALLAAAGGPRRAAGRSRRMASCCTSPRGAQCEHEPVEQTGSATTRARFEKGNKLSSTRSSGDLDRPDGPRQHTSGPGGVLIRTGIGIGGGCHRRRLHRGPTTRSFQTGTGAGRQCYGPRPSPTGRMVGRSSRGPVDQHLDVHGSRPANPDARRRPPRVGGRNSNVWNITLTDVTKGARTFTQTVPVTRPRPRPDGRKWIEGDAAADRQREPAGPPPACRTFSTVSVSRTRRTERRLGGP